MSLIEDLKLADWREELLEHELCEELLLHERYPHPASGGMPGALLHASGSFGAGGLAPSGGQQDGAQGLQALAAAGRLTSGSMLGVTAADGLQRSRSVASPGYTGSGGAVGGGGTFGRVLLRGPRLKVGLDRGTVGAELAASTARVDYRGKVLNRASRIAAKAPSGACYCSAEVSMTGLYHREQDSIAPFSPCLQAAMYNRVPKISFPTFTLSLIFAVQVWQAAQRQSMEDLAQLGIEGHELGPLPLKGVQGTMDLVHCR